MDPARRGNGDRADRPQADRPARLGWRRDGDPATHWAGEPPHERSERAGLRKSMTRPRCQPSAGSRFNQIHASLQRRLAKAPSVIVLAPDASPPPSAASKAPSSATLRARARGLKNIDRATGAQRVHGAWFSTSTAPNQTGQNSGTGRRKLTQAKDVFCISKGDLMSARCVPSGTSVPRQHPRVPFEPGTLANAGDEEVWETRAP